MESSTSATSQHGQAVSGPAGRGPRTVARVLDAVLVADPGAPAIEAASGIWSYADLDDRARRAAGALWSLGVRPRRHS